RSGQPPSLPLQEVQERRHGMGAAERSLPPGPPALAGFGQGRADLRSRGTGSVTASGYAPVGNLRRFAPPIRPFAVISLGRGGLSSLAIPVPVQARASAFLNP